MLKKILLAIVVFAVLGVIGGGIYIYRQTTTVTASGPEILSPTLSPQVAGATDEGPTATLVKETGTVEYKLPDTTTFTSLGQDEVEIPAGTEVKTGEESLAHVVFENNSLMSISQNSQLTVNFEDHSITIKQILGNTWHRVEKVLQGDAYSVETPNTLATVRGTEFNVGVDQNQQSEVYVMESVVDVSKIATDSSTTSNSSKVTKVTKDKHVVITDDNTPIKMVAMSADKKNTDWFLRNKKLTEEIQTAQQEAKKEGSAEDKDKTDAIKKKVINSMMRNLRNNEELNKIDEKFGKKKGQVKGVSTSISDDSFAPTKRPKPTQHPNPTQPPQIPTETPLPQGGNNPTSAPTSTPTQTPTATPTATTDPTPTQMERTISVTVDEDNREPKPGDIVTYHVQIKNDTLEDVQGYEYSFALPEDRYILRYNPSSGKFDVELKIWYPELIKQNQTVNLEIITQLYSDTPTTPPEPTLAFDQSQPTATSSSLIDFVRGLIAKK